MRCFMIAMAITVHKIWNDICWWFTASWKNDWYPCFRREKFDKSFRCWPKFSISSHLFSTLKFTRNDGVSRILANSRGKWICWFMTWPLLETICPPELLQNINDFPYAWPPLPCIHHTWWYPSAKIQITPSSWTLQHCTYHLIHETPKCYLNMIVNLCNCQTASILSIRIVSLKYVYYKGMGDA